MSDQAQLNVNSLKIESSEGETIEQLGVTNVEKTTSKAGYNYDKQISVNSIPLMSTIPSPTSAQQIELLTVDENGQAIGNNLYSGNIKTKLTSWLSNDISGTFLLSEFIVFGTESIILGSGTKRIINESALIVLDGDLTIDSTSGGSLIIENHIYLNSNSKIIYNSNDADLEIVSKYTSGATGNETLTIENIGTNKLDYKFTNWDGNIFVSGSNTLQFNNDVFSNSNNTIQTTGVSVDFKLSKVYNTSTSPATGNVTFNESNARLGVVQKIYHNSGTEPTFTGVANVVRTSGVYQTGQLNRIYAEWVSADRVEYRIENEASGWWHEWNIDEGKTTGKGYIDDAGNFTINLKLSYDNIDITQETFDLFSGVSGVCYVESVWDVVTKANTVGSNEVFADWRINNIIPYSDIRDTRFQLSFYDLIRAGSNGTYDDYDTNDGFLWVGQSFGEWTGASYPTYETYSINPFPEASTLSFIANYNNSDGIREITIRGVISDKTKI